MSMIGLDPASDSDMTVYAIYQIQHGQVTDLLELPAEDVTEYLAFLDTLRESGVTNMFLAAPYLSEMYDLDLNTARAVLIHWMQTFSIRHSLEKTMSEYLLLIDQQSQDSIPLLAALHNQCQQSNHLGDGEYTVIGEKAVIESLTETYPTAVLKCEAIWER